MTLTLAEPGADPVRTYSNGLKVVRLTEYIGAARGTLSTVSDPYAVAGSVVKEEQTIAIPTSFTNGFSTVADSVTIPIADLDYPAGSFYTGWVSVRCEGRPPLTARSGEKFNIWLSNNASPALQLGRDGTRVVQFMPIPREHYANYSMLQLGGFGLNDGVGPDVGKTNLNIRAWGIAGSSPSFSMYLDCLYLIPSEIKDTDTGATDEPGDFTWFVGQSVVDPSLPATDDISNTPLDSHSTFFAPIDVATNTGTGWDIQDSPEEKTEFDWHGNWFASDSELEPSYIYWAALASRLINAHVIDDVDFSDTGPDPSPTGPFVQQYETPEGYQMGGLTGGNNGEFYFADQCMRYRTYSVAYGEAPPSFYPRPTADEDPYAFGYVMRRSGFVVTDPRTYAPQASSLESFIVTHKCNPIDGIPSSGGGMAYWIRGARFTAAVTALIYRVWMGAKIDIDTTGDATVQFYFNPNDPVSAPTVAVGSAVAVPDNLGTAFWVKMERRLYEWRIKIWLDGDTEPASWLLEVLQPSALFNTISGGITMQYPWDTGFPVSGSTTDIDVPNILANPTSGDATLQGWTMSGAVELGAGFNITNGWRFDISPFKIEYDPDSEDEGGYTGANFQIEKYDESIDWGSVYVDPGMCRVAFSDYAPHHFDNDTHGGNVIAWRENGAHPLQTAAYGNMSFRRYVQGGVIPLFRPRVFSVK